MIAAEVGGLGDGTNMLTWGGLAVSVLSLALVYITNRRANRTDEKKLTVEEQQAEYGQQDGIAKRRLEELKRVYERMDTLEATVKRLESTVAALEERDRQKQRTIDEQHDKIEEQSVELDHTKGLVAALRTLIVDYAARVEQAWRDGHVMPLLTPEERRILEDTLTREQLAAIITQKEHHQ